MKWFILGLIFGFPIGLICWVIKLIRQQRRRKKIEENLDTTLAEMAKSGQLRDFLNCLENEQAKLTPKLDDLYYIYTQMEEEEQMNKKLQKWVDSL